MRAALSVGLAALLLLVAGAGCGGSGGGASQPPGSIKVDMTEFKFSPSSLSVKPGTATFYLVNSGSVSHDMVINSPSGSRVAASELVQPGNTSVFTVNNLTAGSYPFICDQPGHEASGMKGTLSVG